MDELKNRFDKNDAVRAAVKQKRTEEGLEDRIAARENQRAKWVSHERSSSDGIASTTLDPATLAAREAMIAEQKARRLESQAPRVTTLSNPLSEHEEFLLARDWADGNPEWHGSEYNAHTMKQIIESFDLPHTRSGYDKAFAHGQEKGHFEEPSVRKRGGFTLRRAPTPFIPPKPPTPEPVRTGNRPVRIEQMISPEENRKLREISFEELEKRAKGGMRAYNQNPEVNR